MLLITNIYVWCSVNAVRFLFQYSGKARALQEASISSYLCTLLITQQLRFRQRPLDFVLGQPLKSLGCSVRFGQQTQWAERRRSRASPGAGKSSKLLNYNPNQAFLNIQFYIYPSFKMSEGGNLLLMNFFMIYIL